jgi:hypothetical protein
LITPGSIGSYSNYTETIYVSSPFGYQTANEFYKESTYYRTGFYSAERNLGTFSSNSNISITGLSFTHNVITDGYPRMYGIEEGSVMFYENGVLKQETAINGTSYSYITTENNASVYVEIRGIFKVLSGQSGNEGASYTALEELKSGNMRTTITCTITSPVQGTFVRVASDGIAINTGNGKAAYFGPDGFHITPLLMNVTTVTSAYTAKITDDLIVANRSSTISITLPTSGIPAGKKIYIKSINSSATVTSVSGSSGRIIQRGSATATQQSSITTGMCYYIFTGTYWLEGYCG